MRPGTCTVLSQNRGGERYDLAQYERMESEVDDVLHRLSCRYRDAEDAYLTALMWKMEVVWQGERGVVPSAVVEQEQDWAESVIAEYRAGKQDIDAVAPLLEETYGVDAWERIDPSTTLYDREQYVADVDWDIELGGVFRAVDLVDAVYDEVTG